MNHEEVLARLRERFPDDVVDNPEGIDFTVVVKPERLVEIARYLRDDEGFDFLSNITSVDRQDSFEVIYHLYSIRDPGPAFVLKVVLAGREDAHVPSVTSIWQGANLQEREVYDLMGIVFDGHPNLKRLLLWDGFPGHPLRKDFDHRTFSHEEMRQTMPLGEDW